MQALPRAVGGICASTAGSMAASLHQQAAWVLPVAGSMTMAQRLGPPHRGQTAGSGVGAALGADAVMRALRAWVGGYRPSWYGQTFVLLPGRFAHDRPASEMLFAPLKTKKPSLKSAVHGLALGLMLLAAFSARAADADPAALPPAVPDTLAQRLQACTLCHGQAGRATSSGYFPRIAGKPAAYLYHQLLHFRDGRRHNAGMSFLLDHMSDAYLRDIAGYFAGLDLPYPPPSPPAAAPAALARGEALVRHGDPARGLPACTACHGAAMTGVAPAVPGLLGLPRDYLIGQLGAWQTGLRHAFEPDCMGRIARMLPPEDVSAVAGWLAAQPVPANAHPQPALAQAMPMACGLEPPRRGGAQ